LRVGRLESEVDEKIRRVTVALIVLAIIALAFLELELGRRDKKGDYARRY
jgi:hypothetical protein